MRALFLLSLLAGCAAETASGPALAEASDSVLPSATGCDYEQNFVDVDYAHDRISAPAALEILASDQVEPLVWGASAAQTTLHLSVTEVGNLREIRASDASCPDSLLLDGTVTLLTEDGRLEEEFDATFRQDDAGFLRLERWVAIDQLSGAWEPRELDAGVHTAADLEIVANLSATGSTGELALFAQREDGGVDGWDVARWPAAP